VTLVNAEPFDITMPGAVTLTVERREVVLVPDFTRLEGGTDGQEPYGSFEEIRPGDFVEAAGPGMGETGTRLLAFGLRPATPERAAAAGQEIGGATNWMAVVFFPLTAGLVALFIFLADGITSRNWLRLIERGLLGTLLAAVFAFLALIPAGIPMLIFQKLTDAAARDRLEIVTAWTVPAGTFVAWVALRSAAWAVVGLGVGLGMNLVRSTRTQLRNGVLGGLLGGAVGGLFFDPIDRFFSQNTAFMEAAGSRAVGLIAVGLAVGLFVALAERLAREGWIRVRTGPLAGKSFVLHRAATTIGSSPRSEIYLFKDPAIEPQHATIHRVGGAFEIEDGGTGAGTVVAGARVSRRRLQSGDVIVLGSTVLEFEERAGRRAAAAPEGARR
jgi:hypothetical protein